MSKWMECYLVLLKTIMELVKTVLDLDARVTALEEEKE